MSNKSFRSRRVFKALCLGVACIVYTASLPAYAETLESALARAYSINPTLNAQRANLRSFNENVPRALSGYRPRISATADVSAQNIQGRTPTTGGDREFSQSTFPRGVGLQVDQTLFNGNRTYNSVRQAESQVFGQREQLRNTEQNVLFDAATSYMNVLRDTAILGLRRNNVEVLEEQLRQVRDRFNVGEVTRTDVAQAEARLAGARSQASLAEANLKASLARFRQNVGVEPKQLAPGKPVERLLPKNLNAALQLALNEHPIINAALHGVDAAELQVRITEGEFYPSIGVTGSVRRGYETTAVNDERTTASLVGRLTIPIYEGGEVAARTRQAKETASERRINVETARDQVRAAVIGAWGALEAARAQIAAAQAQVQAAETALNGVREEARVGQRTTLDVLNAQQELLDARVNLITAQRERVVNSYLVLQSIGKLSAQSLTLKVETYNPRQHFDQVKDKIWGTDTPDGR